jgi:hypothetical protein
MFILPVARAEKVSGRDRETETLHNIFRFLYQEEKKSEMR